MLIADDHAPSRDDIQRALEGDDRFGICASVADAAEAIQAAVRELPDICLLDVRMPGSGLAAVWEIAARLPNAKIVMLTVSDDDDDLFAALRAGADGYLLKTMNLQGLPEVLERGPLGCGSYAGRTGRARARTLPRTGAPLAPAGSRRQPRRAADEP